MKILKNNYIIKIITIAIIAAFFVVTESFCQTKTDSLMNLLSVADDAGKAEIYNKLAKEYLYISLDKSLEYSKNAYDLAEKTDNKKQQVKALNNTGVAYEFKGNNEKALECYFQALNMAQNNDLKNEIASSYNNIGIISNALGNYKKSIEYYKKAYEINRTDTNTLSGGKNLLNIGNSYLRIGEYDFAIDHYQQALKIFKEIEFDIGLASCYTGIGSVNENIGSNQPESKEKKYFNTALKYFNDALKIQIKLENKYGIANSYNNLGNSYSRMDSLHLAMENYEKSLKIREEIGDLQGIASSLNNIGLFYKTTDNYIKALDYYQKSLDISEKINNQYEISTTLTAMAQSYIALKNYSMAMDYLIKSNEIAKSANLREQIKTNCKLLSDVYLILKNYPASLEYYKKYSNIKDSIFTVESKEKINNLEFRNELERKEKKIALLNKDKIIHQTEMKKQRQSLVFVIFGLVLVIIIAFILYNQYRIKQRANHLLEEQNKKIESQRLLATRQRDQIKEQQQRITDSINYGQRIQKALLPPDKQINKILKDYFIFYHPKDIVSGDFYWITQKGNQTIIAAVDCTGHGIPGAFMSMLGVAFLNEIVIKMNILKANEILNQLRDNVVSTLHQASFESESKDGMDISLIIIDDENKKLQFSGAYNSFYLVRQIGDYETSDCLFSNGSVEESVESKKMEIIPDIRNEISRLYEIKADRMPIGSHIKMAKSFSNHEIELLKGDMIYIFTDGYTDQFGGANNKKFTLKRLKNILVDMNEISMTEQKNMLFEHYTKWKGKEEQLDDILIVGIRI
jgi:tetratricopeptide (TPR) repeat protein